jgi:hypothetical protein
LDYIDLFFTPIYLLMVYFVAMIIVSSNRDNPLYRKYFMKALHVRVIGSITLGLIYYFYYKNGDTQVYFNEGLIIREGLLTNPFVMIKMLFVYDYTDGDIIPYARMLYYYYNDPHSFFISKTVGVISVFTFGVYSVTAIFFGILGLTGAWALFLTFCKIAPQLEKQNALAALFLPSVFFWGSGILKDTLTFSAMGWFVYGVYHLFFTQSSKFKMLVVIIFSSYVMYSIKEYILLSILPACLVWVVLAKMAQIKNTSLRLFLKPVLFTSAIVGGLLGSSFFVAKESRYNLENVVATSSTTAMYLRKVSNESNGSTYDLGDFEPTLQGALKLILPAINVALFRPYPWEIKNALMLLSSLESMFFLLATLLLLYRVRFATIRALVIKDPFLICCFIFSLMFSFAVGISSYNFGTLVRYKIPMLPFYTFLIFYVYQEGHIKQRNKWREKKKQARIQEELKEAKRFI